MAFTFNPFTGNFDDVKDVAEKAENSGGAVTDNAIVRFDGTTGTLIQNSLVTIDDSGNMIVAGDLTVNGTTTTVNSATLDVTDANITVNNNGNDASSEGAGLTVERTGTDGSFIYADACVTKFKIGALGSEIEIADISSSQTITNKTIDADNNTITDIANASIATAAAINFSKMESLTASRAMVTDGSGVTSVSTVTATELGFVSGVTSSIQTQLDAKAVITDIFSTNSGSGTINSASFETYLADTSGAAVTVNLPAPTTDAYIVVKDSGFNANTNNITVAPNGGENIEGSASNFIIDSDGQSTIFVSNGTDWFIL